MAIKTEADVQSLIDNQVQESLVLEYKRQFPRLGADEHQGKKELVRVLEGLLECLWQMMEISQRNEALAVAQMEMLMLKRALGELSIKAAPQGAQLEVDVYWDRCIAW